MTTAPETTRLRAETREIPAGDAAALDEFTSDGFAWLHHGMQLVATGTAARVPAHAVDDVLASIESHDTVHAPGTGPIAVGALPFDPDAQGDLVIPARVVGRVDGHAWVTDIGPSTTTDIEAMRAPTRFSIAPMGPRVAWCDAVDVVLDAIARGDVEKVVLAREVRVEADVPFDAREIVTRLVAQQPGCFVYAADGLVGASPELLVRRAGAVVESRPVAGTATADSIAARRALAASVKDTREHRFVVEGIVDALQPVCTQLEVGSTPDVAVFGPIAHLATRISGHLRPPAPSALTLARLLSPTPAVGGTPRDAALDAIRALEGFDRGRYAGPVGWLDARGDGEWAIALRGAELNGTSARLVAGAGIVAGSDPAAEWAETQAKFEPMLRALVRP